MTGFPIQAASGIVALLRRSAVGTTLDPPSCSMRYSVSRTRLRNSLLALALAATHLLLLLVSLLIRRACRRHVFNKTLLVVERFEQSLGSLFGNPLSKLGADLLVVRL